ncbi:casein kinase I [Drosophila grimshawi]|uniref:non-specific serine/threonine protein kinase n=1 Tax=Drosophila grimshawi TaxID=7222 RepID=B4JXJ1_DROGR|nr:casein kinase I [Drosophila grimshawi]EDV95467.1 GH17562 [Drosophila grimshawi]
MELFRESEAPKFLVGDYTVHGQFDSGSFGDIYLATSLYNGEDVAIKMERADAPHKQLAYEYRVYKAIRPALGLPQIYYFCERTEYRALVMELLGPSLDHLFELCSRQFTMKTVLMLADEMVQRLEQVHSRGFVHRDVKPRNILIGRNLSCKRLHLIDFGLSKKCWDPITSTHIPYREDRTLTGTARFTSINSHEGLEQSRRDDLISMGYMLIYFLRGKLPWQGIRASTKHQKYERIYEMKQSVSNEVLCQGLPSEFAMYLNYCYQLAFDAEPDYKMVRKMFRQLTIKLQCKMNQIYDWEMLSINYHRNQANPASGRRARSKARCHKDNASSGYPIIFNEKCNRWD